MNIIIVIVILIWSLVAALSAALLSYIQKRKDTKDTEIE